jgi:excisionase family DNA binding protein
MAHDRYDLFMYYSEEERAFIAEVPDLPGCMADGRTRRECLANLEVIVREWIETAREIGRPVPRPRGRLMAIAEAAERLGLSVAMTRRYCAVGKLPAQKIGRDRALYQRDVDAFAVQGRTRGRPSHLTTART